jgi:hypothetical protein
MDCADITGSPTLSAERYKSANNTPDYDIENAGDKEENQRLLRRIRDNRKGLKAQRRARKQREQQEDTSPHESHEKSPCMSFPEIIRNDSEESDSMSEKLCESNEESQGDFFSCDESPG